MTRNKTCDSSLLVTVPTGTLSTVLPADLGRSLGTPSKASRESTSKNKKPTIPNFEALQHILKPSPNTQVLTHDTLGGSDGDDDSPSDLNKMFFKWRNNEAYELQVVLNPKVRRRIQNRAAQRAFRQRKEQHIKELQEKLSEIEEQCSCLVTDNNVLRSSLQQALKDNDILLASMQEILLNSQSPLDLDSFPQIPDLDSSILSLDCDDVQRSDSDMCLQ